MGSTSLVAASEDDEVIEEVIVTGSFIRRDNFDVPSPMDVMTELDMELAGTSDLGDLFFDQTYQFGVAANAAPFDGTTPQADDQRFNQGQEVSANLRGLGTRATMTMIDGHRLPGDASPDGRRTGVDVNATYPSIAVARVETILDGASALYGAEAVAGVINLIPKKNFEGLQ
ncbi:MAG: TonB-dependent receptor plug domain-containing protein, partial [Proteobacteria bacterium]|nr:TonB-dependent receptor plug domain-containing protein [Pseudomonadota bacterium]